MTIITLQILQKNHQKGTSRLSVTYRQDTEMFCLTIASI